LLGGSRSLQFIVGDGTGGALGVNGH